MGNKTNLTAITNFRQIDTKKQSEGSLCRNCGKITQQMYRPFCSRRCAHLDLGHWLSEDYRVPVIAYDYPNDVENDDSS